MKRWLMDWWRDWRRGYSDRDLTIARLKYEAATHVCKPGSFTKCTMGELRAMHVIEREDHGE